mgnify:CR=1 FL=1
MTYFYSLLQKHSEFVGEVHWLEVRWWIYLAGSAEG